jgi:hypothetical protein
MKTFEGPSGERLTSNGSEAGNAFVSAYAKACADERERKAKWLSDLRAQGITTAAPDDGWVNREHNTWMPPSYCDMLGPIEVGTRVALGTPDSYRVVEIIEIESGGFVSRCDRYRFKQTPG